jgi:hypothetical protein
MERLGVKLSHNPHPSVDPGKLTIMHGSSIAHQDTRVVGEVLTTLAPSATDTTVDAMMNFRNSTGEPLGHPYDIVRRRRSVGGGAGVEKPAVVLRRLAGCEVAKGEEVLRTVYDHLETLRVYKIYIRIIRTVTNLYSRCAVPF